MAVKKKNKRQPLSLASGRPPTVQRSKSISRKATKSLINKHHLLEKRRQQAIAKGDEAEVSAVAAEIESLGGIEKYQQASLQGQREDRGGDSSRVLMGWLDPATSLPKDPDGRRLRLLEVGALSVDNACSRSGLFDIERIDLNSQSKGILQQDFMERPLPRDATEKFDLISLSLVLNFVPDPKGRGEMLLRTLKFLHEADNCPSTSSELYFPGLFLVLPAPCVSNSRYLDEERLVAIMASIGYVKVVSKATQRLVYYLWKRSFNQPHGSQSFPKEEIRGGPSRNNFAIVLKQSTG
ncbi:putative methyltransferase-domain-containing protein [Phialemonium atrogriseum]|uniref:25S rRNA adenine-N(1) methyltransferase n=1 Tax=Phialemonium atrogriseum TaxID=1093897 RepID=A0AAJ0C362_9PEZI|nr:putative methyltransferase-domain-containing protein [Phialemonium atrogriseum]KAK1769310.1 putative methyltransferase-domain-containing protein [Phialemonium atrogriseum]